MPIPMLLVTALLWGQTPTADKPSLSVDKPSLTLYQGRLVLRTGGKSVSGPLETPPASGPLSLAFRKNSNWVVWDERGLTLRSGTLVRTSRMEEQAVSPRIFSAAEIKETLTGIEARKRMKGAYALSGAKRVGRYVYLVPRWVDTDGRTWLETLVRVDLESTNPKPELLMRVDGISPARVAIDDLLSIRNGALALPVQRPQTWGFAVWDPNTKQPGYERMGATLGQFFPNGWFTTQTTFGTYGVGSAATIPTDWKAEGDVRIDLLDGNDPGIGLARTPTSTDVYFLNTGAVQTLVGVFGATRLGDDVALFSPVKNPAKAFAYDGDTGALIASWRQNP